MNERFDGAFGTNWVLVLAGAAAAAALSAAALSWPSALLSSVLAALMMIGADIDARTHLLPDAVTIGALACGVMAAAALEPLAPSSGMVWALVRAGATAAVVASLRSAYAALSGQEGIGLGDVKLAAAVGAWLPAGTIPLCFALACGTALAFVLAARLGGRSMARTTAVPLGAFLCPSLWIVFFATVL